MYRTTDPITSRLAAEHHIATNLSERRLQVMIVLTENPGSTSGELSRRFYEKYGGTLPIRTCVETAHKRLPELESLGMCVRGAPRKCLDGATIAITWWPIGGGYEEKEKG
jgi:hypothetical protein